MQLKVLSEKEVSNTQFIYRDGSRQESSKLCFPKYFRKGGLIW
jgi:hypothetical protein